MIKSKRIDLLCLLVQSCFVDYHFCTVYCLMPDCIVCRHRRYNVFLMVVTYFLPLVVLAVTYVVIGRQLWGSQAIGERTEIQLATISTKRRVIGRVAYKINIMYSSFVCISVKKEQRNW
jgi:hypothetical protein